MIAVSALRKRRKVYERKAVIRLTYARAVSITGDKTRENRTRPEKPGLVLCVWRRGYMASISLILYSLPVTRKVLPLWQ